MLNSNNRPDLVIHFGTKTVTVDVRTCDPTNMANCIRNSQQPGFAALSGECLKDRKWVRDASLQGDVAVAVCHEAGGTIGEQALNLLSELSSSAGGSPAERAAFTTHALQCLHATNSKGVATMIRSRNPIKNGPCLPQRFEAIDLGALPNCPTRYATVLQAPAMNPNVTLNDTTTAPETTNGASDSSVETDEPASKTAFCDFCGTFRLCSFSCGNCLCLCRCARFPLFVSPLPPALGVVP